jgi:thioredoxin reductase (NADPH)
MNPGSSFRAEDIETENFAEDPAHPFLSPEMIDRLLLYGKEKSVEEGGLLFSRGDRDIPLFVILRGKLEVFEQAGDGGSLLIATICDRQFTGELDLWNNRQSLVTCRAATLSHVLSVSRMSLARLLRTEPDIANTILQASIWRRRGLVQAGRAGILLIGDPHEGPTIQIQRFLVRNAYPHRLLDVQDDESMSALLGSLNLEAQQEPIVVLPNGRTLRNPDIGLLAQELGFCDAVADDTYDVAIVGAGPAGLAAAVNGASEGLKTLVIEGTAPGGQAGMSSRIENYLGFPSGLSGQELANRAQIQAQKFGARLAISRRVIGIEYGNSLIQLRLSDDECVKARSVVIASGAEYRKLDVPGFARFEGSGIHYAATGMEGNLCLDSEVAVIGSGNSAGQAALFLARNASHVYLVFRGTSLGATMSDYLVQRISASRLISIHPRSEIEGLQGDIHLERATWINNQTGRRETHAIKNLFVLIGATPNTAWLQGEVQLDHNGFVCTGAAVGARGPHETSRRGVFAIGDVRSGSVKRVASAAGEGSVVISEIHQHLAAQTGAPRIHPALAELIPLTTQESRSLS